MNWYKFLQDRLALQSSYLKLVLSSDELLLSHISPIREEKTREEIIQVLQDFNGPLLGEKEYELKTIFLLRDFNLHKEQISQAPEKELIPKVIELSKTLVNKKQELDSQLNLIASTPDIDLLETQFQRLKPDYQKLIVSHELKSLMVQRLKELKTPEATLTAIFNDF